MSMVLVDRYGNPLGKETSHRAASRTAKEFASWNPPLVSANGELAGERETLVARHRDLERNNGVVAGVSQTYEDNIIGSSFRLVAKPDFEAIGLDREWAAEWSKKTEARWRSYADSFEIDAARQFNFIGLTKQVMRSVFSTGEAAAIPLWLKDRQTHTAIQLVDSDRLSTPPELVNDKSMRDGIRVNGYGEATHYYVQKSHPADYLIDGAHSQEWERIPARSKFGRSRFLHIAERKRMAQSRTKPATAAVMSAFKMLDNYQEYELKTVITNSMIAAFVETSMSGEELVSVFGGDPTKFDEARNQWDAQLSGGAIIQLPPGDKLSPFTPSRSATAYAHFVESIMRHISAGLNLPYELLMKDFSKTNYSSARAALLEAWRFFLGRRRWLTDHWAIPVYSLWLEEEVNNGYIEAPNFYEFKHAYCRGRFIGAARGYVDPLKEAKASELRIALGISTYEDECAEQGKDWEEVFEQRARENKRAEELGLTLGMNAITSTENPEDIEDDEETEIDESEEDSNDEEQGNANESATESNKDSVGDN